MESENYIDEVIETISKNTGVSKATTKRYLEKNNFDFEKTIQDIAEKINSGKIEVLGGVAAGTVYGNVSNASTNYGIDKFNTPSGHGFAAERANDLHDKLRGKKAEILGDDNAKHGPDRVVDGVNIQSKYCSSGSECISACFEDGKLKYLNSDGTPMKIEVPSDKYEEAIRAMERRIKSGQVPGVSDPNEASNIVKKGSFTYEQAKNIAKFGTVESITFDAVNGAIIATTSMGITTAITFAVSVWNGEDFDVAVKNAVHSGLKVGGVTFATAILSSQLGRTGLNSALVGSSEAIVSLMGPKASAMLVNAFRSGGNIYGAAAMKSAAKLLRGNAITGAASIVVLSSFDVVNIFRGRISGSQLFKNITNTAATVAGGTGGWIAGASAGASLGATIGSVIPIVGTAIGGSVGAVAGGIAGSFAGGAAAGKVSGKVLDEFIEDDANKMLSIIERNFIIHAENYLLSKKEAEESTDKLKGKLNGGTLKDMYKSEDRDEFANNLLVPIVEEIARNRQRILLPSKEDFTKGLRVVLEEL